MTRTIFDVYNDVIRELDGTNIPKVSYTEESDFIILQPGTNDDVYRFYIDPAVDNKVSLKFEMTNFATQEGEIPSGVGDGEYDPMDYIQGSYELPYKMTTTNFYNFATETTIGASSTVDAVTVDVSNIPFNYNHADILIQYTVKTSGAFDVSWDLDWVLSSQGEFPNNISPNDLIQSDDSDVDLSYIGSNTSLLQRFYIKAIPNMRSGTILPSSTLTAKVTNNLGTSVTLGNVIIKPAFLHYVDYPADGQLGSSLSTEYSTSNDNASGNTCYYVKTNGQIIAKINDEHRSYNPSMHTLTGHYLGTEAGNPDKTITLTEKEDNNLIFTQADPANYLTSDEVTLWRNWTENPSSYYYFGPINIISFTKALPQLTNFRFRITDDGTVLTLYASYAPFATATKYWTNLNTSIQWFNAITSGILTISYSGLEMLSAGFQTWSRPISDWPIEIQNAILSPDNMTNSPTMDNANNLLVISHTPSVPEQYVVTDKLSSVQCGKRNDWDSIPIPPPDPDIDPDIFPTVPEGPSYLAMQLNHPASENWVQISSNTNLVYVENTSTGELTTDYQGTLNEFYLGYGTLNSISYYAPATIAVNCIVSYNKYYDTYVEGYSYDFAT